RTCCRCTLAGRMRARQTRTRSSSWIAPAIILWASPASSGSSKARKGTVRRRSGGCRPTPALPRVLATSKSWPMTSAPTAAVARSFSGVRVLDLPVNEGKGGAMRCGVAATSAGWILFLDADLIGLRPDHVVDLVLPVVRGEAEMTVGVFRGGRLATDLSHFL